MSDEGRRRIERALAEGDYTAAARLAREHVRGLPPGRLVELSGLVYRMTQLQREGKLHEDYVSVVVDAFDEYRRSAQVAPPYEPSPQLSCPTCGHLHISRRCACSCEGPTHL